MSFPVSDWQFWVVTVAAMGSFWALVKPFLPGGKSETNSPCSHCGVAAGAPCGRANATPGAQLVTLGGRGREE